MGYDPESFFSERFKKFGADDLRGPGDVSRSRRQNLRDYRKAWRVIRRGLTARFGKQLLEAPSVVEIGVGTGFYTERLARLGAAPLVGVDITDVLFAEIARKVPGAELHKLDVTSEALPGGPYRLMLMIDVTQHILDDEALARGLCEHIAPAVAPGGVFVFTTWDDPEARDSFYERSRPLTFYTGQPCFAGWDFSEPVPFRDKSLVMVHRPGG